MKYCPCPCGCRVSADSTVELEMIFGWRGKQIQSYCKKCRGPYPHNPHKENQSFENIPTTNVPPIFEFILKGLNWDFQNSRENLSKIPKYDKCGKLVTRQMQNLMKNLMQKEYLLKKNNLLLHDLFELIEKKESLIEVEQFLKLFESYNLHTKKIWKDHFYNFIISDSKEIHLKEEFNPNSQIYVILKLYSEITETYMKILSTKLNGTSAIIINFVTDTSQNFISKNENICVLNRDMIKYLIKHRLGVKSVALNLLFGNEK